MRFKCPLTLYFSNSWAEVPSCTTILLSLWGWRHPLESFVNNASTSRRSTVSLIFVMELRNSSVKQTYLEKKKQINIWSATTDEEYLNNWTAYFILLENTPHISPCLLNNVLPLFSNFKRHILLTTVWLLYAMTMSSLQQKKILRRVAAHLPYCIFEKYRVNIKQRMKWAKHQMGSWNSLSQVAVFISIIKTVPFLGI
jgi:ERCC4-type nuclease